MTLYYEAHVTVEPVFDERLEQFKDICRHYNFKAANLLMQKRAADTAERSAKDTFCTGHGPGTGDGYDDLAERTRSLVRHLQARGFQVWRYKIEAAVIDSRSNDQFALLREAA